MVARILIIASVACVLNLANGFEPPFPGFKPCKSDDNDCMLQDTNAGIPFFVGGGMSDIGIKSSDPDHYEKVDCSKPNLEFILTHVTLTGLKHCKAVELKRDEANLQLSLVLECDLKLEGNYFINGTVILLKIEGSGKIRAELPKLRIKFTCNYDYKEGKDGETHLHIKNFEHNYELKKKATLEFDGLYPDNEVLRAATTQVLKDSPNEIIYDIGTKMIIATVTREVEYINKFFKAFPIKDISLA